MTRKQIYQKEILKYGFLPLLKLLEQNKQQENYEECKIIYDVVNEHSKKYNLNLPTEFDEHAIEEMVVSFWRMGYSGQVALNNLPSYCEKIKSALLNAE